MGRSSVLIRQCECTDMSTNRYKYFRWTPRTALITFNYVILVPAIFGVVAYSTDVCTYAFRYNQVPMDHDLGD